MPVFSKTVKKITFRRYKHSKLAYRTYLNSTHNAIFYSNMDEIVAVITCQMWL